jgi:hypothetical protein
MWDRSATGIILAGEAKRNGRKPSFLAQLKRTCLNSP